MKSQRKKGEERPDALRWFKVMYPETYRQTRRPLWFEGTHLQVVQDREQGIIPMICQGEQVTILDPRAIVFTPLDPRSSARWTTPRATQALDDHAPWARKWLLSASPLGGARLRAGLGTGHHAREGGATGP